MTSLPLCSCRETGIATCPRHGIDKSAYARDPKPKSSPARKKGLREESSKQATRTAFLHGVKAERLYEQEAFGATYHCESEIRCFETTVWEEAWNELTLHHTVKRSKGHGYIDYADFGVDEPRLLLLVCKPCHQALESNPEWSKSA